VPKVGTCCLCGSWGGLSFEPIPPRAAYNDHRVFEANISLAQNGGTVRTVASKANGHSVALAKKLFATAVIPTPARGMALHMSHGLNEAWSC
jgi:hypothetical protein